MKLKNALIVADKPAFFSTWECMEAALNLRESHPEEAEYLLSFIHKRANAKGVQAVILGRWEDAGIYSLED